MSREDRLKYILRNAIIAYEFELESQDYQSEDVIHSVVLDVYKRQIRPLLSR